MSVGNSSILTSREPFFLWIEILNAAKKLISDKADDEISASVASAKLMGTTLSRIWELTEYDDFYGAPLSKALEIVKFLAVWAIKD